MPVALIAEQRVEDVFDVDVHEISTVLTDNDSDLKQASELTCTLTSWTCCCP